MPLIAVPNRISLFQPNRSANMPPGNDEMSLKKPNTVFNSPMSSTEAPSSRIYNGKKDKYNPSTKCTAVSVMVITTVFLVAKISFAKLTAFDAISTLSSSRNTQY